MKPMTLSEYVRSLPKPSDIRPIRHNELRTLYRNWTSGQVHGNEDFDVLLFDVESRLIARAELILDFANIWGDPLHETRETEAKVVGGVSGREQVIELVGTGSRIIASDFARFHPREGGFIEAEDVIEAEDLCEAYGVWPTDWGRNSVKLALEEMKAARRTRDPKKRMVAIDKMIRIAHGRGPLGAMFIEGGDEDDVAAFLDELSGVRPRVSRRVRRSRGPGRGWWRQPQRHSKAARKGWKRRA